MATGSRRSRRLAGRSPRRTACCFRIDALSPFAEAVAEATVDETPPQVLFIITDSPTEYQAAIERLPVGIETVQTV